ncbi:MAG TPA: hypothetical protein VIB47_11770 [Dehalococcoidia bacterium]|jgi:hypothetical protein
MKLRREQKFIAWGVAAVAIGVAAFLVGGALKPEEPPHYLFDVEAPAFQTDLASIAATSQGGFTGFGELAGGDDRTVLGGRVVEVSATSLTLETQQGSRTTLRLAANSKLWRLDAGSISSIKPGATVIVKRGAAQDDAAAVLVVSKP